MLEVPAVAPLASDEGVVAEASGLQHFRNGMASDGKVYRNDHGERVKLDKRGKPYRVDDDGVRKLPTHRPEGMRPEAWQQIQPMLKRKGITYDEYLRRSKEADTCRATKAETSESVALPVSIAPCDLSLIHI